jgi:pyruvate dehydrogenase E1 component alpha subunit
MNSSDIRREDALAIYRKLMLARLFEEKVAELYRQGHVYGFCHLYIGQEAVMVGLSENMKQNDGVITGYRDHVHMLLRGISPKEVMAELCGKSTGCSGGKGGSMHMYSKDERVYGGNGIVGAQVPIGAGLAFAHKYRNDGGVSFTFFGDGAANQGQVYETFNMAALWKLPAVFVLENNHYGLGTSVKRAAAGGVLTSRGDPFGIRTVLIDGMDVFDVRDKSKAAIEEVRSGGGPVILHVDTYRYKGHSMSDPAPYRTRDEVEEVKKTRDPIMCAKHLLTEALGIGEKEISSVTADVTAIVDEAAKFAIDSTPPPASALEMDVTL